MPDGEFQVDDNIRDQVAALGYDNHNPMLNLGTITVVLIVYFVKVMGLFFILYPVKTYFGIGAVMYDKQFKKLFFTEILVLIIEGYIELLLAAFMNISAPQGHPENIRSNHIIDAILLLTTLVIVPATLIMILSKPFEVLKTNEFKEKFGALYEDLRMHNKI